MSFSGFINLDSSNTPKLLYNYSLMGSVVPEYTDTMYNGVNPRFDRIEGLGD